MGWSKRIVGQKLSSIVLDKKADLLTLSFHDGDPIRLSSEGDCCSSSWIEHLESLPNLDGAIVTGIRELDGSEIADPEHECLRVYQTVIDTDRGSIAIEYRNSSNGYYGGWLYEMSPVYETSPAPPEPAEPAAPRPPPPPRAVRCGVCLRPYVLGLEHDCKGGPS